MRLLCIHAARLGFEGGAPATEAAKARGPPAPADLSDCLVVSLTVEPGDEAVGVAAEAAAEIRQTAARLNTDSLALLPTEHLSDAPAAGEAVDEVLAAVADALATDHSVTRAPTDWFLALDLASKGHPHAVRSVHVTPADVPPDAGRGEREWTVLTPDGQRLDPVGDQNQLPASLAALVRHDIEGEEPAAAGEPSLDDLLRDRGFAAGDTAGEEPESLHYSPAGTLVRESIRAVVDDLAAAVGATPVESAGGSATPAGSGDRAAAAALRNWTPGPEPRHLFETRTDEPAAASHRPFRGQRGATIPTLTSATSDDAAARDVFVAHAGRAVAAHESLDLAPVATVRTSRTVHDAHADWFGSLAASLDQPVLLDLHDGDGPGWLVRLDLAVVAGERAPVPTGSVKLESLSEDEADGESTVVHCEPVGSLDAAMAALLARGAARAHPRLPTWLSPTQVRFVPIEGEHVAYCVELADRVAAGGGRVDVDDRTADTVGRRLADAEADWVPYVVVVGDREVDGAPLKVQVRATGRETVLTVSELAGRVRDELADVPAVDWSLPRFVSRQGLP
ncbi:threonyl-tRNA synthetase editing domain-containing protein [Haloarchaeobius amylolyticus]|uniref:threonyl-tRNA synthetase editing domain-containing protein n=1 Tax=Haloarchaeobius amylolyticus TaxID=1198296 RepID=UPI00226E3AE3|nr:threonyl-tRNA synthetase editing domain-containing protein [Haloarchaeobius amylolyticus]